MPLAPVSDDNDEDFAVGNMLHQGRLADLEPLRGLFGAVDGFG
jgi:hypothetical protein